MNTAWTKLQGELMSQYIKFNLFVRSVRKDSPQVVLEVAWN